MNRYTHHSAAGTALCRSPEAGWRMSGLAMPGYIRDGAPDAWGRRVLINKKLGLKGVDADSVNLYVNLNYYN